MSKKAKKHRAYRVECPACGIEETMIFQKSSVELFYHYAPSLTSDDDKGKKGEKVFKPKKGIAGDIPPNICHKCGGELKVEEFRVQY